MRKHIKVTIIIVFAADSIKFKASSKKKVTKRKKLPNKSLKDLGDIWQNLKNTGMQ